MFWLIGSLVYAAVALPVARSLAGAIAWSWAPESLRRDRKPDAGQWFVASVLGFMAGIVWPLVLLIWFMPAPVIGAEREHRLKEREQRIKELEKELGL